jgi:hypothetical protein
MAGGQKRKPNAEGSSVSDLNNIPVASIKVDHRNNTSRAAIYDSPPELEPFIGPKCCFTLAEIEGFLNEPGGMKDVGQLQPIGVFLTKTGETHLVHGHFRHATLLLAHVRGVAVPGAYPASGEKMIRAKCVTVTEPKSADDWRKIALRNAAENAITKRQSPVDIAYLIRALSKLPDNDGNTPDLKTVAASMLPAMSYSQACRYLSLLELHPSKLVDVHEGRVKMSAALKAKSESGLGSAMGPRPAIAIKAMRRAVGSASDRPPPDITITGVDLPLLLAGLIGDKEIGELPEHVQQAIRFANCPKPEKVTAADGEPKAKKPRKAKTELVHGVSNPVSGKAPPRLGAKEAA